MLVAGGWYCGGPRTDLTASVPEGDGVVVGRVGPGACGVDPAQLVHVVVDVAVSCRGERHLD